MAANTNVWRIANPADLVTPVTASLSAQDTFCDAIAVAGANRHIVLTIAGTWAGTVTLQVSTDGQSGWSDVAGRTYTGNQSLIAYSDGLSADRWYRLGFKTGEYTSGTADITLQRVYSKQEAVEGRITLVDDADRGTVVKLQRFQGDALVSAGYRTEIARNYYTAEYALGTGGGWYWFSYKMGPEWAAAAASGELDYNFPPGNSKSALIMQFAPNSVDGTHPVWSLRVSERGVSLHKNKIDDSTDVEDPKYEWPIDEQWHDIVTGIIWQTATEGRAIWFLDGKLVYREEAPQMYAGAAAGCYWKQGMYFPGTERNIAVATIYSQGFSQWYPGSLYSEIVGANPISCRPPISRSAASVRTSFPARSEAAARISEAQDIRI